MNYVVYLDVFLVINIFMDFLILVMARNLIKPRTTIKRCIFAAVSGGILSVLSLIIPYKTIGLRFITSYILICFVMSKIAFKSKGFKDNLKNISVVYAVTFLLGGVMNVLYYKANINLMGFISVALATYLITDFIVTKVLKKNQSGRIYKVCVSANERMVALNALLDTGNLLYEPISRRKVHIIEYEVIKDIINKENGFYRVIPFNSVGKQRGLLDAIEVDFLEITDDEGRSVRLEKEIVALYDKKLTLNGRFEGLLHSSISELI